MTADKRPELDWDTIRGLLSVATLSPWMLREIATADTGHEALVIARVLDSAHAANQLATMIDKYADDSIHWEYLFGGTEIG